MADILVVEDDISTRKNIKQLLEKSGYGVLSASSGEEALGILEKDTPDLIVSDIMMPGIDGYELFRLVNREDSAEHIPFIFLTAKTEIDDFRTGMQAGVDDYITKPFRANDLLVSVGIRLKKKAKIQKKIEQFKASITRNMSHEFRTPLVPIIGFSQLIKENFWDLEPSEILDMAGKIHTSGAGMLKIIEKFLLLVELEENIPENNENKTSVKEIVNTCAALLTSRTGRGSDLMLNVEDAEVNIPEVDLERIMTELVDNAFRFSNPGSPVEVTSEMADGFHIITISDYGKGMTPDQLKNISSFFQYSSERVHKAGLGLGLAIVRKLADKNRAIICMESELGIFTRVKLKLPFKI